MENEPDLNPIPTESTHENPASRLDHRHELNDDVIAVFCWGRTGFDHVNTLEAACRGRCVGLVNNRIKTKKLTKN